jgi:molybdate transport system permease protein
MKQYTRLPIAFLLPGSAVMMVLLIVPTLVVVASSLDSSVIDSLLKPVVIEALKLSLLTTALSLAITLFFGTPLAYILARYRFPGQRVLDTLLDLPIMLPPTVAGLALLLSFGRRGWIGSVLNEWGASLSFTTLAVVIAQVFVASPLYIRSMKAAFAGISERLEGAAVILGLSRMQIFWRVTLPLVWPYFFEGVVLMWARALGEFGATMVFAGSLQGRTQTMPLAIYAALEQDLESALVISAILTLVAFTLLFIVRQSLKSNA